LRNYKQRQQIEYVANHDIRFREVRVVGPDDEKLGVMPTDVAKQKARNLDLDLVLVTDKADIPVCCIVDLSKFLYQQKQALKEQSRRQRQSKIELKEVQFRPNIDVHDFNTKCKNVSRFIDKGALVKLVVQFRGRERSRTNIGFDIINNVIDTVGNIEFDSKPQLNGNKIIATVRIKKDNV
jgi:translation initiation factor IF-3